MKIDWKAVQARLRERGIDPGPIDGIPGRRTTAAIREYQRRHGINVRWPGTLGAITMAHLFSDRIGEGEHPADRVLDLPPWYVLAGQKKGLHEKTDNAELRAFLKSDGATLGDPSQLPWCGDFIETVVAITLPEEPMVTNPYLARNWLKFGVSLPGPAIGAIGIVERGTNGISGHVWLYGGENATHYRARGGNQMNTISDVWIEKSRLLGFRWPSTWPLPEVGPVRVDANGEPVSTNEA